MLRDSPAQATASADWRNASVYASNIINVLREALRLREALDLAEKKADYTRQAGLGPWTQLADQAQRLQILVRMGEHQQVLAEIPALLTRMQVPRRHGRRGSAPTSRCSPDLTGDDGKVPLPGTPAEVITVAERTEGVRLGDLITALEPDTEAVAAALARILDTAATMPAGQDDAIGQHLQQWEPVIAGIVGAAGGGPAGRQGRRASARSLRTDRGLGRARSRPSAHRGWRAG